MPDIFDPLLSQSEISFFADIAASLNAEARRAAALELLIRHFIDSGKSLPDPASIACVMQWLGRWASDPSARHNHDVFLWIAVFFAKAQYRDAAEYLLHVGREASKARVDRPEPIETWLYDGLETCSGSLDLALGLCPKGGGRPKSFFQLLWHLTIAHVVCRQYRCQRGVRPLRGESRAKGPGICVELGERFRMGEENVYGIYRKHKSAVEASATAEYRLAAVRQLLADSIIR